MVWYLTISWDSVETLGISSKVSIKDSCQRVSKLVELREIVAVFKHLELARMYVKNCSSPSVDPYSIHSKNSSCDDKHPGTELGCFHESGKSAGCLVVS